MEELQQRHRREQKELQSRITQKKKSASKKTRKGVNDECTELERQLKERQELELAEIEGSTAVAEEQDRDTVLTESEPLPETQQETVLPASDQEAPITDSQPVKKRNRQKERLARRAAEQEQSAADAADEAANQTDHRAKEREIMEDQLKSRGLVEQEVRSDGHCLYAAMADQLKQNDVSIDTSLPDYKIVRRDAATFIAEHAEDFAPFLEDAVDEYVVKVRDTAEWGGQVELLALARTYGISINVLQGDGRVETIAPEIASDKTAWLAYYRHSFGLGEHYNSLRVRH